MQKAIFMKCFLVLDSLKFIRNIIYVTRAFFTKHCSCRIEHAIYLLEKYSLQFSDKSLILEKVARLIFSLTSIISQFGKYQVMENIYSVLVRDKNT